VTAWCPAIVDGGRPARAPLGPGGVRCGADPAPPRNNAVNAACSTLTCAVGEPPLSAVDRGCPVFRGPARSHIGCERPGHRATQRSRFALEPVFDTLFRWGLGTTRTWAGRSRRRCSGARSCSASTWPPSMRRLPTSSPTCEPTGPGSGPDTAGTPAPARGLWPAARGATSTVDERGSNSYSQAWARSGGPAPQGTAVAHANMQEHHTKPRRPRKDEADTL
jgi:hypothetical protein